MANQNNFPDQLPDLQDQRPSRVSQKDVQLIQRTTSSGDPAESAIVFGQTLRDVVEVYVYDELNQIVGHINLRPGDPALRLLTFASDSNAIGAGEDTTPDNLQIDLVSVLNRLHDGKGLPPGRYSVSLNFFRDEVGQEFVDDTAGESERRKGARLYIAEVSPSRTELRLRAATPSPELLADIRNFVTPSVPMPDAQALIDQTFGTALGYQQGESITVQSIEARADDLDIQAGTISSSWITRRLARAKLNGAFAVFILQALPSIRNAVLDELATRVGNLEIDSFELQQIIADSTAKTLQAMVRSGVLHKQIALLDNSGNIVAR